MDLQEIRDVQHFDLIRGLDEAVIYKHGPMCWSGMVAHKHVRNFSADHPNVPVFIIDVVRQRALSRHIADILQIRHESPQAIILQDGHPVWEASHYRVTRNAIVAGLERARKRTIESIE